MTTFQMWYLFVLCQEEIACHESECPASRLPGKLLNVEPGAEAGDADGEVAAAGLLVSGHHVAVRAGGRGRGGPGVCGQHLAQPTSQVKVDLTLLYLSLAEIPSLQVGT